MEALVRKLEGFSPLPAADQLLLLSLGDRRRQVAAGADIISEGDTPSDVHLISAGLGCRYKMIEGGRRQIVAYLLPGDFCDLHVFILKAMDHSISVLAPSTVLDIPRNKVLELLDRPAIARALLMATLVDEGTLREWITNIGQRRAEERIAHLFCELYARMKIVGLVSSASFDLPVTQTELGDTVGLSVVQVNRSLQSLRAEDLIVFKGGRLHIPDIGKLEAMSDFRPNYLHLAATKINQNAARMS